ncbi:sugar transferase [Nocardioides sp. Leaf307]|uniref:sugar transferase n=1 Tax=Nocardioides sp. Leaf307 TaxID=1736331 RepID=UPI000703B7FC|nr:sugar transferase [Nocardioides sp. Leaf307]KQQ42935.1 hypothetical protein ASF50_02670 [Nocardioides sp. Leaf307]
MTGAKRAFRYLPTSALVIDTAILACVGALAAIGRRELDVFGDPANVEGTLTVAGPLMVAGWLAVIAALGGYRQEVFGAGTDEYKRVFNGGLVAAGLTGVGSYLTDFELSRGFFLMSVVLGLPSLLLGRFLFRRALYSARRRGSFGQRVLIAGTQAHIDEIAAVLSRESWLGYRVIGALTPAADDREETPGGIPVLGDAEEASLRAAAVGADVIFFAGGALGSAGQLRRTVWELEQTETKIHVVVAPSVTDISGERIRVRPVGGLPLMHIDPPTWTDASRWGKRAFDVAGSLLLIMGMAPFLLAIAATVRISDGGPVFFKQTRTGRHGDEFGCFKFRTMVVDAEARLAALHAQAGYDGGLFKMKDDPRVTRPGRLLRRLSLDELPQLFNVLRGDMSLVGPRPPLPREVAGYEVDAARRLRVRPGMTGLWQVSGRSDLSYDEAIRLDLYYVDNWSMLQDLSILGKTVGAVFASRGAY